MMFTSVFAGLLFPVLVACQYGPAPGPASPASSSSSAAAAAPSAPASTSTQVNVDVAAGGQFIFNPSNITAANGTQVTFFFPSGLQHSVTESSFAEPCTYLTASGNNPGGFDSGLTSADQFTLNITNDQEPIWFHCKQVTHCGLGMVGSINAPTSGNNTFQAFQAAAVAIGSSETTETDNGPVTGGVGAVATASPANTASAGSSSSTGTSSSGASQVVASSGSLLLGVAAAFILA